MEHETATDIAAAQALAALYPGELTDLCDLVARVRTFSRPVYETLLGAICERDGVTL